MLITYILIFKVNSNFKLRILRNKFKIELVIKKLSQQNR
jgi:hypothetical protein